MIRQRMQQATSFPPCVWLTPFAAAQLQLGLLLLTLLLTLPIKWVGSRYTAVTAVRHVLAGPLGSGACYRVM